MEILWGNKCLFLHSVSSVLYSGRKGWNSILCACWLCSKPSQSKYLTTPTNTLALLVSMVMMSLALKCHHSVWNTFSFQLETSQVLIFRAYHIHHDWCRCSKGGLMVLLSQTQTVRTTTSDFTNRQSKRRTLWQCNEITMVLLEFQTVFTQVVLRMQPDVEVSKTSRRCRWTVLHDHCSVGSRLLRNVQFYADETMSEYPQSPCYVVMVISPPCGRTSQSAPCWWWMRIV